jgi:hypothetical protein
MWQKMRGQQRLKWLLSLGIIFCATSGYAAVNTPAVCAQLPALTGDATTTVGSCATTDQWHLAGAAQTVSASAAGIQFTSLPSGYNRLYLNCNNVTLSSTSNEIFVQVGEGGTPTWETGAHYTYEVWYSVAATTITSIKGTASSDLTTGIGVSSTSIPTSFWLTLDNYTSTSVNKMAMFQVVAPATGGVTYETGASYWNNDTSAITGVQVVPSAGTISMTCSLYAIK